MSSGGLRGHVVRVLFGAEGEGAEGPLISITKRRAYAVALAPEGATRAWPSDLARASGLAVHYADAGDLGARCAGRLLVPRGLSIVEEELLVQRLRVYALAADRGEEISESDAWAVVAMAARSSLAAPRWILGLSQESSRPI